MNTFEKFEQHKSLEDLKEIANKKLHDILHTPLTVETIDTFADVALNQTVNLMNELLEEYRNNPNLEGNLTLNTREQEDDICLKLGLENINQVLEKIEEVKSRVDNIKNFILTEYSKTYSEEIITPPDHFRKKETEVSGYVFEKKKLIPRMITLLYILEIDFGLDIQDNEEVNITEGSIVENMMRNLPYMRIVVPDLSRVIYICDEEGNASYIFDMDALKEFGVSIENLDSNTKKEKNTLIEQKENIGIRIVQSKNWRNLISKYLSGEIKNSDSKDENISEGGEFTSRFLSFDEFSQEINTIYQETDGNIDLWYRKARKKYPKWPSNPHRTYKDAGWQGWPEILGKENPKKKEYLAFEDFKAEVKKAYPGLIGVRVWYEEEQKNNSHWPIKPERVYKDAGWLGWSELVDRENPKKKEYLTFENFREEILRFYPGSGDINDWYQVERKNHYNWPSDPYSKYKDSGWQGWRKLIGKK